MALFHHLPLFDRPSLIYLDQFWNLLPRTTADELAEDQSVEVPADGHNSDMESAGDLDKSERLHVDAGVESPSSSSS